MHDVELVSYTKYQLQQLINRFAYACREVEVTISCWEAVDSFTYLGSTIASNACLIIKINTSIAKDTAVMSILSTEYGIPTSWLWKTNWKCTRLFTLSTLLYGGESLTTYARQERWLETFYLDCLWHILDIQWHDRVSITEVLEWAGSHSMHLLLSKQCLWWLKHVHLMEDDQISKNLLYRQLATGSHPVGHPLLCYKDVCKRDPKPTEIDTESYETAADDHSSWRSAIKEGLERRERKMNLLLAKKRNQQRQENQPCWSQGPSIVIQNKWMPSCGGHYVK